MSGYYILAIVFAALAILLVFTYDTIKFVLLRRKKNDFCKKNENCTPERLKEGWYYSRGAQDLKKKFCIGFLITVLLSAIMATVGLVFQETARAELSEYTATAFYADIMSEEAEDCLDAIDEGKNYEGLSASYANSYSKAIKETIDFVARVSYHNARFGRFSRYWTLIGEVRKDWWNLY